MAVTLTYSNVTIRGITYSKGSSFKCASAQSGNGGSEGNAGSASALTVGTTYYFHAKATGDKVTYPYAIATTSGGSVKGWYKEAIFPYATYSVKYNANGGSGAPAAQTKTYGTNLTLSSTKPTRTGYTFQGWGTSASDTSVNYAAGATYSTNAAITLYAIWKANTCTISFNANGGSGAPSSVTKTYGVNIKLPTTKPTRTNYEFLGWSASSTASTATYSAGGTYTGNANATLYAVWKLKYELPTITNLKAIRCGSDGTADDFGTYAKVTFNWSCSQLTGTNNVSSITVNGTAVSASGTSGSVTKVVGGSLSIETTHTITVKVIDTLKSSNSGATTKTTTVPAAVFAIDFKEGGKGVGIGKPATEENLLDVQFKTKLNGGLAMVKLAAGSDLNEVKTANFYSCLACNQYTNAPPFKSSATFLLEVYYPGQAAQIVQRAVSCDTAGYFVAVRCYYASSGWGEWNTRIRGEGKHSTWIVGRDNALLATTNSPASNEHHTFTSMKTTNGAWDVSTYTTDRLYLTYTPDAKYNANENNGYVHALIFDPDGEVWFSHDVNAARMYINNPDSDTYYNAQVGDYSLSFGIGNGKVNRGIYDHTRGHWLLANNENDTLLTSKDYIYLSPNNNAYGRIAIQNASSKPALFPEVTNGGFVGINAKRFTTFYSVNAVNVSSDRRLKDEISYDFTDLENVFDLLKPAIYKLKSDKEGKLHIGFVAQDAENALKDSDFDPSDFAFLTKDEIEKDEVFKDGYSYGIGYTELIALNAAKTQSQDQEIKCLKATVNEQQNKINDLEARLEKLEAFLSVK